MQYRTEVVLLHGYIAPPCHHAWPPLPDPLAQEYRNPSPPKMSTNRFPWGIHRYHPDQWYYRFPANSGNAFAANTQPQQPQGYTVPYQQQQSQGNTAVYHQLQPSWFNQSAGRVQHAGNNFHYQAEHPHQQPGGRVQHIIVPWVCVYRTGGGGYMQNPSTGAWNVRN